MGYYLQALIGKQETLEKHLSEFKHARMVILAQGIAMIPITDELDEEIGTDEEIEGFYKLSPGIEDWAKKMSASDSVSYIEADFFGGSGGQSALAWSGGARVLGPVHAERAINECLQFLRVDAKNSRDEFEALGLGKHLETADWVSSIKPGTKNT